MFGAREFLMQKCIHWSILIFRKITKIGATRCQILRLKCTKFDFRCPRHRSWSLQRSPDALATGLLLRGERERGCEGKGRNRRNRREVGSEGEERRGL